MAVRLSTDEEELCVGSGLDIESRYLRQRYQIVGIDAPAAALEDLARNTDFTREVRLPVGNEAEPRNVIFYRQPLTVRRVGFQLYESDVLWNGRKTSEFEINVRSRSTGGTKKILGGFFTAGKSKGAPDFGGLIAYNPKTQEVEGTEIVVPAKEFEIECSYPPGYCSDTYLANLDELTGYVNAVQWRRWAAGTLLYLGNEYSEGSVEPQRIAHHVRYEPNLRNITSAGLSGINKDGHDFLWFLTADRIVNVQGNDVQIKVARHWYSERVFPRVNFATVLGF